MAGPNNGRRDHLPVVNLVTLVAAVATLWWRAARVEAQVDSLRTDVGQLKVAVAVLTAAHTPRP